MSKKFSTNINSNTTRKSLCCYLTAATNVSTPGTIWISLLISPQIQHQNIYNTSKIQQTMLLVETLFITHATTNIYKYTRKCGFALCALFQAVFGVARNTFAKSCQKIMLILAHKHLQNKSENQATMQHKINLKNQRELLFKTKYDTNTTSNQ